jgi:hypothetical protein
MTHAGRKPLGPALVQHLEGSKQAKQRLEVILKTITGELTIDAACQHLGIQVARLHELRTEVLEAALARLEPRPMGRPRRVPSAEGLRCEELQGRVEELEAQLQIAEVQQQLAQVMPHVVQQEGAVKKTPQHPTSGRRPIR